MQKRQHERLQELDEELLEIISGGADTDRGGLIDPNG